MGSSGSGSFSDYSGRERQGQGNASSGGGSGDDLCRQAFHAGLEDVSHYDFFSKSGSVPAPGTVLTLAHKGRIIAVDPSGVSVGALPTKFNYLAGCLRDGVQYTGVVVSSSTSPVPRVDADFVPV